MTSPRRAEATADGRYYTHPTSGQSLVSVTNALSVGCAKPALVPWATKIVAEKVWDYLPRMIGAIFAKDCGAGPKRDLACNRCRDCLTRDLKGEVTIARDKASDLGSRVHALAEAHLAGATLAVEDGDDVAQLFVAQYVKFLKDFDVDPAKDVEAIEITVANPGLGYAGTLDVLLYLKLDGYLDGEPVKPTAKGERALWLIDLKTSLTRAATSVYGEYALQLTGLRHASEMWLPDDTTMRMVSVKGCAVLNLRRTTYELIPLPAGQNEFTAFKGCLAIAKFMHSTGKEIAASNYRPVLPDGKFKAKQQRGARKTAATPTSTKAA